MDFVSRLWCFYLGAGFKLWMEAQKSFFGTYPGLSDSDALTLRLLRNFQRENGFITKQVSRKLKVTFSYSSNKVN